MISPFLAVQTCQETVAIDIGHTGYIRVFLLTVGRGSSDDEYGANLTWNTGMKGIWNIKNIGTFLR